MDSGENQGLKEGTGEGRQRRASARKRGERRVLELTVLFVALFTIALGMTVFVGAPSAYERVASEESVSPSDSPPAKTEFPDRPVLPVDEGEETATSADAPVLALVIDDWGYGWDAADRFLSLDVPLNVAVIPYLPYSGRQADDAAARGDQVLLHLPMEPLSTSWRLEKGTVTTAMTGEAIARDIREAYEAVPHATGINNHMGSKATADPRVMGAVLRTAQQLGTFFLDSRTTSKSVVADVADAVGVTHLTNDRFIDPDSDTQKIRERLVQAAKLARRRGWAIAIGHVHPATYRGVRDALPEIQELGVRLGLLDDIVTRIATLPPGSN